MKKLMIAAAIVCAAAISQGAQASWAAGDVMAGSVGDRVDTGDGSYNYLESGMGYLFVMGTGTGDTVAQAAADWAMLTSADAIWSAFDGVDTITVNGHSYKGEAVAFTPDPLTWSATSGTIGDTVYAAIILTAQDAVTGEDMYSANAFSDQFGTSGLNSGADGYASLQWVADGTIGEATTWNAVPEPTSGLLLLLGVAGLALRRRRA